MDMETDTDADMKRMPTTNADIEKNDHAEEDTEDRRRIPEDRRIQRIGEGRSRGG